MQREAEIQKILHAYEEACFIDCDPEKAIALMTDNAIGVGIGGQDTVCSKEAIKKVLRAATNKATITVHSISYCEMQIRFLAQTCASLTARVCLRHNQKGKIDTSSFMQSLTLIQEGDAWRISQFHASPIMLSLENTEASPLLFSDTVVENLRSQITTEAFDLMSASFVGGVVGVHHVGDKFPLYFANEGIARFLGYTVEEFHQVFKDDVSQIIYAGDYEHVMELTEGVLAHNIDVAERIRLQKKDGSLLPVIDYARKTQDSEGRDILIAVFTDITELVELYDKLETQNANILSSIRYASKIQQKMLPSLTSLENVFSDVSALWKPKDIVGGDVYWLKEFDDGAVLVVCDCTGHGTPGALITMLVASILDNVITEKNCSDTARLMRLLDKKISTVLNVREATQKMVSELTHISDGCDIALLFVAKDGTVTFSSSGIHVFMCNGTEVQQIKGQRLSIGSGALKSSNNVRVVTMAANPENKFYIASDGLYDQIGGEKLQSFGYKTFKDILLANHGEKLAVVSEKVWSAFEQHRGENVRRDDVELISFQP